MRTATFILTCCTALLLLAGSARAQEMEPRAYSNAPIGMNFVALSYGWSRGNVVTDAALPIEDFHVTAHTIGLGYVRTIAFFGKQAKVQAAVPMAWLSGGATIAGRDTSGARDGFADARVKFTVNLAGGDALSRQEFRNYQQKTIVGASVVTSIPIGHYDPNKAVNIGANRWGFKPEVGVSRRFGPWYAEVFTGVWMFSDNQEFLGTSTLSQEPVWTTQGHLSRVFRPGLWAAGNAVYVAGGESAIDGVSKRNFQKNWRFGATLAVPITQQHGLKFAFNTGVATRIGADFDSFTVVYQYSWF